VNFGFFTDPDTTRYCYLRLRRLKEAIKDPRILDGLIRELAVPGAGQQMSARQKVQAIDLQIENLRGDKTSIWHGAHPAEVLAAAIFNLRKVADSAAGALFNDVTRKEELASPIRMWFNVTGFKEYDAFPPGTPRVDVVGYQAGRLMTKVRVIGVELHNDLGQLEPALERMAAFAVYTHATYLACTPALAAEFLLAHTEAPNVGRWDPAAFRTKLSALGFGLLLVEGDAVSESLAPKERKPDLTKALELIAAAQQTKTSPGR
jgi:hypothetical protein